MSTLTAGARWHGVCLWLADEIGQQGGGRSSATPERPVVAAMAVYQSQAVAFARYATAQVTYWERVLALHQVDGTGCCQFCGRLWPCDQLRHSRRMVKHFRQWAL
jgi:hypothetical protein